MNMQIQQCFNYAAPNSQAVPVVKNPPANAGDARDAGRSPGGGNGNPLQYSCLENPMDRGSWWATVHRVAESDTTEHACLNYTESRTRSMFKKKKEVAPS